MTNIRVPPPRKKKPPQFCKIFACKRLARDYSHIYLKFLPTYDLSLERRDNIKEEYYRAVKAGALTSVAGKRFTTKEIHQYSSNDAELKFCVVGEYNGISIWKNSQYIPYSFY